MCFAKIPVANKHEFIEAKSMVEDAGYPYRGKALKKGGYLLLWSGDKKIKAPRHSTGARNDIPCNKTIVLEKLAVFLKGRAKTAYRCKHGIEQIDPQTQKVVAEYDTVKEAAIAICQSPMNIYKAASPDTDLRTAYGFIWRYKKAE